MATTKNSVVDEFKEIQASFIGGMNRSVDPTRIGDNQYTLLFNGRNRYDTIKPIKLPEQRIAGLPTGGNLQGIYGAASIIIVFIDGLAYFQDFNTTFNYFRRIPVFQMSKTAPVIYAELVPASSLNFHRTPINPQYINQGVNISNSISATPQAVVVQDGINQPWLIFPDGSARVSQTYKEWDVEGNREYVPLGKQMLYTSAGSLQIVSVDGTHVFSSVEGRPLDFVKIIDQNGDKLPNETEGGVLGFCHNVDFAPITCIARVDTPVEGGFFVSTNRSSYIVAPNYNDELYGEPKYTNTYLFSSGAINNFCVNDILGDTTLIDFAGIKSFNAVTQFRIEGKNSPFFAQIFKLFEDIIQSNVVASWTFDNYGHYAVNTIYGFGILIYDTITKSWVGMDIYPGVSQIKQFAEVKTVGARLLFFGTVDGKIYQMYAGNTATCILYTKEYNTGDTEVEMVPEIIRPVFLDPSESGVVSVTPFINHKQANTQNQTVKATNDDNTFPISILPFGNSSVDSVNNLTFNFQNLNRGWKAGFLVSWNFMADLSHFTVIGATFKSQVSVKSQAAYYEKK